MSTLITILHVIVCLFLMLTVLLQSGKAGGMGAAFGGGNAATVFGSSGASGFLKRLTAVAGTVFMITSMVLAFIASHNSADALEKFGNEQQKLADEKEKAKADALKAGSGAGSNAGSAALTPFTPAGSGAAVPMPPAAGSADAPSMSPPAAGSAEAPAAGSPATPAAENPAPPAAATPPPAATPPAAAPAPAPATPKP